MKFVVPLKVCAAAHVTLEAAVTKPCGFEKPRMTDPVEFETVTPPPPVRSETPVTAPVPPLNDVTPVF